MNNRLKLSRLNQSMPQVVMGPDQIEKKIRLGKSKALFAFKQIAQIIDFETYRL